MSCKWMISHVLKSSSDGGGEMGIFASTYCASAMEYKIATV